MTGKTDCTFKQEPLGVTVRNEMKEALMSSRVCLAHCFFFLKKVLFKECEWSKYDTSKKLHEVSNLFLFFLKQLQLTGWGLRNSTFSYSENLQSAEFLISNTDVQLCAVRRISDQFICIATPNQAQQSACFGDSGKSMWF